MSRDQLSNRLQERFDAVCETKEAQELLNDNPLEQYFLLELAEGGTITIVMEPHTAGISVKPEAVSTEAEFQTTRIELTEEILRELIGGAYFSTNYLNGAIIVRGLQPAWLRLGRLFGINHELQA